jgi:hypothetical protein
LALTTSVTTNDHHDNNQAWNNMGTKCVHEENEEDRMLNFRFDLKESALVYIDSREGLLAFEKSVADCVVMGIDTETQPAFQKRTASHFLTHPTSIMQIALRSSRGTEDVFIIDLLPCLRDPAYKNSLDTIFLRMLQDATILKVGQGLANDFDELHMSYPSMKAFEEVHGIVETHSLVQVLQPEVVRMLSLKALVQQYLHYNLVKTQQCSNWGKRPLNAKQIQYAACDALVLLRLYDAMTCEAEELFAGQDKVFNIKDILQSANLTAPKPLSKSALKRKSTFFKTREDLRVQTSTSTMVVMSSSSAIEANDDMLILPTPVAKRPKQPAHTRFVVVQG